MAGRKLEKISHAHISEILVSSNLISPVFRSSELFSRNSVCEIDWVYMAFMWSLYGVYGETRFSYFSEKSHDSDDSKYTVYN